MESSTRLSLHSHYQSDVPIDSGCLCPVSTEHWRWPRVISTLFIFATLGRWPANTLSRRGQRTLQSKETKLSIGMRKNLFMSKRFAAVSAYHSLVVAKVVRVASRNTHWSGCAYKLWIKSPFILKDISKIAPKIYTIFYKITETRHILITPSFVLWCCLSKESPVCSMKLQQSSLSSCSSVYENFLFLQYCFCSTCFYSSVSTILVFHLFDEVIMLRQIPFTISFVSMSGWTVGI